MKKIKRVALTAGIVWGVMMFLTTLAAVYTNYAMPFLNAFGSIYPGYQVSLTGSLIGAVYGFLDAFIGVYIIAWVYRQVEKNA